MGGGPVNPILIDEDQDDMQPFNAQVQQVALTNTRTFEGASAADAIKVEDDDDDLKMEDADEAIPANPKSEKVQLLRELKALGINPAKRPDYTAPLAEPSWGDSDEEEEDDEADEEMEERDGVLDGEDEDYEDDEVDAEDVEI